MYAAPSAPAESRASVRARRDPRKFNFKNFLSRGESDCGIALEPLQYHDFDGDGLEEVLVVASTCYTGTGGPDIHAVYKVLSASEAIELRINDERGAFHGADPHAELIGNRNYFLYVDDAGRLVEEFHDSSNRPEGESPLILYFKWSGKEFMLDEVRRHVRGRF
jgi:hypothetical protein